MSANFQGVILNQQILGIGIEQRRKIPVLDEELGAIYQAWKSKWLIASRLQSEIYGFGIWERADIQEKNKK